MKENLEGLLKELSLRIPLKEIKPDLYDIIYDFLSTEKEYRKHYKIARLLRVSGIKQIKTLNQFDWHFNPKISKEEILTFHSSTWVENASNLVLIGDSGLGNYRKFLFMERFPEKGTRFGNLLMKIFP